MFYLTEIYKFNIPEQGVTSNWRLFDYYTDTSVIISTSELKELMKEYKVHPVSTNSKGEIEHSNWPRPVRLTDINGKTEGARATIIAKLENGNYKMVSYSGGVYIINEEKLESLVKKNEITNCRVETVTTRNLKYTLIDVIEQVRDIEFENKVQQLYKEYISKSLILGIDGTFEYEIWDKEVIITDYTGKSSRVVLPNFITSIRHRAFHDKNLDEVKLNNGLKYIGKQAFAYNNLENIEIPSSVEFINKDSFEQGSNRNGEPKVNLLGSKTIAL